MELTTTVKELFDIYQNFQQAHPHIGTMLTSEVILLTADAGSQLISDKKLNKKKLAFTAQLAPIYGLSLEGLMETGNLVGEYIYNHSIAKSALGPNLFGNIYNIFFFANNTIGEKNNYSIKELLKTYYNTIKDKTTSVKEKFVNTLWNNVPKKAYTAAVVLTLTFWNVFQTLNYEYIPEELRSPATLGVSLFWTLGLTYHSLIGSRKIAKEQKYLN
ncbi:MAG: Mpv17/PMP22 family protein [Candidatus Woesearchaeota archaeon]